MAVITLTTRDGRSWTPRYLEAISAEACIGCGRCYKVCGHNVMKLMGLNEDGDLLDPEDDEDEELVRKVMTIADQGACVGCGACARVCGSKAQTHITAEAA